MYVRAVSRFALAAALTLGGWSCRDAATAPVALGVTVLSPRAVSLLPLDSARLLATVTSADGIRLALPSVAWRSLDTAVARVDAAGLVTATTYPGPAVRTTRILGVGSNTVGDTALVEVRPWPVQRVRIARDSLTLLPRDSATVGIVTETDRGVALTGRDVVWLSSDTAALQAQTGGRLRARPYVGAQTRTIVVTAFAEGRADTLIVIIPPLPVASLQAEDSVVLVPGQLDTVSVVARSAAGEVLQGQPLRWRSTDTTVVRTNADGVLTAAFYAGALSRSARVIVESDRVADTVSVRVAPLPVARVGIRPDSARTAPGAALVLEAVVQDAAGTILDGRAVTWRSTDSTVATVNATGRVTAAQFGGPETRTARLIATVGAVADTMPLVVAPHDVRWISATPEAVSVRPGDTLTVVPTLLANDLTPLNGRVVTWASLDTAIAVVSPAGRLTVRAYTGPLRRTTSLVVAQGSAADTVPVEVLPTAVARVVAAADSVVLAPRDTAVLLADPTAATGTILTGRSLAWIGGDTAVAAITAQGVLRARPYGGPLERRTTALVFSEGQADTVRVVVRPLDPTLLTLGSDTLRLVPGTATTAVTLLRAANGDTLVGFALAWRSADTTIARVNADGVVTASFYAGAETRTTTVVVERGNLADTTRVVVTPLAPTRVAVSPDTGSLRPGQTFLLDATVRDAAGTFLTGRTVDWSSLDADVATVNSTGLVTAVTAGRATARQARIVGRVGTLADTSVLTVLPHDVASVTVTPEAVSLLPLDSLSLSTVLRAADLTVLADRSVAYTSVDPAVASVTAAGRLRAEDYTGPLTRTTRILATSGGVTDTVPVEVLPIPVARVVATPEAVTLFPGDTLTVTRRAESASGRLLTDRATAWLSSDTAIVRLDTQGRITIAPYAGTETRVVSVVVFSEARADTVPVTVAPLVPASVTLAPDSLIMRPGDQQSLAATVRSAQGIALTGRVVTWAPTDTTIARVNGDGIVSGAFYVGPDVRIGTVVASTAGVGDTARVRVLPLVVTQLELFPASEAMTPNRTVQLDAVTRDAGGLFLTGRTVTWTSTDTSIASVSPAGLVRSRRAGTARIVASSGTGVDTTLITITRPAVTLRLTPTFATVWIGRTQALALEVRDSANVLLTDRDVQWTSSNPAAVAVSSTGVVSGVGEGMAVITARVEGLEAQVTVDAFPEPAAAITITFDDAWRGVLQYAAPIMDTLRLRGNVGWITDVNWSGVMTPPELRQLQDRGWTILSHSMTHPRLTDLTLDSARVELSRSRTRIDTLGFNPRVFIVPFLAQNPDILAASATAGYAYTRCCVQDTWSTDTLVSWPIAPSARHRLAGVDVTDYTGQVTTYNFRTEDGRTRLRELLETVVAQGKFIDVFFHDIVPADLPDLRLTLQILANFRRHLITYDALP